MARTAPRENRKRKKTDEAAEVETRAKGQAAVGVTKHQGTRTFRKQRSS
jgi:hypothetical protein